MAQNQQWASPNQFMSPQQRQIPFPQQQFQMTHQQVLPSNQVQTIGTINTYKPLSTGQPQIQQQTYNSPNNAVPHVHQYMVSNQQQRIESLQKENVTAIHEVHHIERPLQVVAVDDFETKWKTKCFKLEQIIYDLQVELQKYKNTQPKEIIQYVHDDARIRELEARIRQYVMNENELNKKIGDLEDEIVQWKDRYNKAEQLYAKSQGLSEQIKQLQNQLDDLQGDLDEANMQLRAKDDAMMALQKALKDKEEDVNALIEENDQFQQRIQDLNQSEQRIITVTNEAEMWKKRFRDSNQELSKCQEELELTKANLDALRKQGMTTTVVKETTLRSSGVQNSSGGGGTTTQVLRSSQVRSSNLQQ